MKKYSIATVISILFACSFFIGCATVDSKFMSKNVLEEIDKMKAELDEPIPYDGKTLQHLSEKDFRGEKTNEEMFSIFHAASAPKMEDLNGEYDAFIVKTGKFSILFDYYLRNGFGPGSWVGKAFGGKDEDNNFGYNLFASKNDGNKKGRTIKFETVIKKTKFNKIDNKDSYHLIYKTYNKKDLIKRAVCDEIRKINDELFIGIAIVKYLGKTPGFFVLHGKPRKWEGTKG